MTKTKRKLKASSAQLDLARTPTPEAVFFIPGPKLRAKLGISAVTLWRWRHDPDARFPTPKIINGRLYFAQDEVTAWMNRQPEAT